eukprot:TRINITY_DN48391_c0_g1_i1.p1 TRINITY_DN48391_c0_g1~~TRINITY_DN48391_c0_g1_i1.p1  ORF type:complete len:928 (+),score=116.01 TRINITY_DN48391_c0_g1_i1:55-2838(+)
MATPAATFASHSLTSTADSDRSVAGKSMTPTVSPPTPSGIRAFRSLGNSIRGIVRAQAVADSGAVAPSDFDPTEMVMRIAVTLNSHDALQKITESLFLMRSEPTASASIPQSNEVTNKRVCEGREFPLTRLPELLNHWCIPEEHLPIFWALLRKHLGCYETALPAAIGLADLQTVLTKALRRLRDKYCVHRVTKGQFVSRNTRTLTDEYIRKDSCGQGSFGTCFWITHRLSKMRRVCKRIPKEDMQVPEEEMPLELDALKQLDHPNILQVFEWFETEDAYELVTDAAFGGDLRHTLAEHGNPGLEEQLVVKITVQSLEGLAYMHSKGIVHRDIKPANMLLSSADFESFRVLLADFGVAEFFDGINQSVTLVKGTVPYMAPEVFANKVCLRTDCWALGIVVFELLCGSRPFKGENPMLVYASLRKNEVNLKPVKEVGASEEASAFLQRLLSKDENVRATSAEALDDPWCSTALSKVQSMTGREVRKARQSMFAYVKSSHFAKVAMHTVMSQLDTASLERLSQLFESFDKDHNGVLSASEMAACLGQFGIEEDSIAYITEALDVNCNGSVDYSEFCACLLQMQGQFLEETLNQAFRVFDVNKDGSLTLDELQSILGCGGPLAAILPDGMRVQELMKEVDLSQDGRISLSEFKAYLRRGPHTSELEQKMSGMVVPGIPNIDSSKESVVSAEILLDDTFRNLAPVLHRSEAELSAIASDLKARHWLRTVGDLQELGTPEWRRLELPLKLEIELRKRLCDGGCSASTVSACPALGSRDPAESLVVTDGRLQSPRLGYPPVKAPEKDSDPQKLRHSVGGGILGKKDPSSGRYLTSAAKSAVASSSPPSTPASSGYGFVTATGHQRPQRFTSQGTAGPPLDKTSGIASPAAGGTSNGVSTKRSSLGSSPKPFLRLRAGGSGSCHQDKAVVTGRS